MQCAFRSSVMLLLLLLLSLGAAAAAADPLPEPQAYARACLAERDPQAAPAFVRVRRFGDNAATAAVILDLIRRGEKSVTFTTPALYAGRREVTPVVDDIVVVTDFDGRPGAVVRTTSVRTVPFNEVTEADSRYEGPPVRPLEAWRRVHWAYFTRELAPLGQAPSETLAVTIERFELLCSGQGEVAPAM
jgi:uncharacterized protein YhfF